MPTDLRAILRDPEIPGVEGQPMAKGQAKSNKETKKPKSDKPKGSGSAYKQAQGK